MTTPLFMKYFMRVKENVDWFKCVSFTVKMGRSLKCFRGIWGTNGKEVCGNEWGRKKKC